MTDQPAPSPQFSTGNEAKSSRPWFKKKRFIIPLVLVLLIAIGAAVGGGSDETGDDVAQSSSTTAAGGTAAPGKTVAPPAKSKKGEFTLDKYNQLQNGMTYEEVKAVAGGEPSSHSNSDVGGTQFDNYTWPGDGLGDTVSLSFQDGKLSSKTQFGLGAG